MRLGTVIRTLGQTPGSVVPPNVPVVAIADNEDGTGATLTATNVTVNSVCVTKVLDLETLVDRTVDTQTALTTTLTANLTTVGSPQDVEVNHTYLGWVESTDNECMAISNIDHFFVTNSAVTAKYHYGGMYGRDLSLVVLRSSYIPKQFNDAGEEQFQETNIEVSGFMNLKKTSLRRGDQGRVQNVDARFYTLYELEKPYPNVTVDGIEYKMIEIDTNPKEPSTEYTWYLIER